MLSGGRLVATFLLLTAGAEAVAAVHKASKPEDLKPNSGIANFVVLQDGTKDDINNVWHVHGEPGHQWRWIQNNGKWERQDVTPDEAKQATPAGQPDPVPDTAVAAKASAAKTDSDASNTASNKDGAGSVLSAKVNVDIYFETRCPGCLMFLNQTLEPLYRTKGMSDLLNITLYTYGNTMTLPTANISEGYKFFHPETTGTGYDYVNVCQHGSDECLGDLVQVCAQEFSEKEKHLDLVFCMAATTIGGYGVENSAYQCMIKAGIDKDKVRECVGSAQGNQLMAKAWKDTEKLEGRQGTPWVMINGEHAADQMLQDVNLLGATVCGKSQHAPDSCSKFKAKASSSPAPAAQSDIFQVFLSDEEKVKDDFIKVHQEHV